MHAQSEQSKMAAGSLWAGRLSTGPRGMGDAGIEPVTGASRIIGESTSAGMVLVVIAYRDLDGDLHGINAWPATGPDLAAYEPAVSDGEEV